MIMQLAIAFFAGVAVGVVGHAFAAPWTRSLLARRRGCRRRGAKAAFAGPWIQSLLARKRRKPSHGGQVHVPLGVPVDGQPEWVADVNEGPLPSCSVEPAADGRADAQPSLGDALLPPQFLGRAQSSRELSHDSHAADLLPQGTPLSVFQGMMSPQGVGNTDQGPSVRVTGEGISRVYPIDHVLSLKEVDFPGMGADVTITRQGKALRVRASNGEASIKVVEGLEVPIGELPVTWERGVVRAGGYSLNRTWEVKRFPFALETEGSDANLAITIYGGYCVIGPAEACHVVAQAGLLFDPGSPHAVALWAERVSELSEWQEIGGPSLAILIGSGGDIEAGRVTQVGQAPLEIQQYLPDLPEEDRWQRVDPEQRISWTETRYILVADPNRGYGQDTGYLIVKCAHEDFEDSVNREPKERK